MIDMPKKVDFAQKALTATDKAVAENPDLAALAHTDDEALKKLVGVVMKDVGGSANPAVVMARVLGLL